MTQDYSKYMIASDYDYERSDFLPEIKLWLAVILKGVVDAYAELKHYGYIRADTEKFIFSDEIEECDTARFILEACNLNTGVLRPMRKELSNAREQLKKNSCGGLKKALLCKLKI